MLAVPSKAYAGMTWLDHVNGCACCLTRTRDVSPCYLAAKGCQDNATLSDCCYGSGLPAERNKAGSRCLPLHVLVSRAADVGCELLSSLHAVRMCSSLYPSAC